MNPSGGKKSGTAIRSDTTETDVRKWIDRACKRPRPDLEAAGNEITCIARLVRELRAYHLRDRGPEAAGDVIFAKLLDEKKAVRDLLRILPNILQAYEREGVNEMVAIGEDPNLELDTRTNPEYAAQKRLYEAVKTAYAHIGDPPREGRPTPLWHIWARALVPAVRNALTKAGRKRLSHKPNGPLVAVLCDALHAIDGEERQLTAVEAIFDRRRKKRGAE